jgi:hypothetical protein
MRKYFIALLALLAAALVSAAGSLYDQSMARLLEQRFADPEISYQLLDARTGRVVASRWEDPHRPRPLGSLVKPFTALAYGQAHRFHYPEYVCRGKANGCWYRRGHGRISMTRAVADSCNAYFRLLAAHVPAVDMQSVLRRFGLEGLPADAPAPALLGLGEDLKLDPLTLVHAYLELTSRRAEPGVPELVQGMALSAQNGTGRGVGRALSGAPVLVKTGTAPCVHEVEWSGDGYVLALYPPQSPRWALLVQVHGVPGAEAAVVGGRMLRTVLDGK